jgi:hypothetical protein
MNRRRIHIATATLVLVPLILSQGCLVSRLERPRITGQVLDAETGLPLEGCRVGETTTDAGGYFELEEKRYRQFTWIGMEAPPVIIQEEVSKEGYETYHIDEFLLYGGGQGEGAHWALEPILLHKKAAPSSGVKP